MWEEILRKWGSRSGKTRRWITDLDWSKPEIPDNNGELVVNRIKFRMYCLFLRRRWKRRNVAGSYEFASASQYQKIRIIRLCRWNNITVSRCSILVSASVPQSGTKSGFAYNWSCNGAAEVISGLTRLPKDFPPPPPPDLITVPHSSYKYEGQKYVINPLNQDIQLFVRNGFSSCFNCPS